MAIKVWGKCINSISIEINSNTSTTYFFYFCIYKKQMMVSHIYFTIHLLNDRLISQPNKPTIRYHY